jgi:small subunit ribosomal protein S16
MDSIRLARHGAKKAPVYRIVAADVRAPRDGRFIEILGTYTPTGTNTGVKVKLDRVDYWISQGAKPTDAVARIVKQVRKDAAVAEA